MTHNSLKYPTIDAKHFHYHNDGTGRDTYVSRNNGGLLSQKMLVDLKVSIKPQHKPLSFPTASAVRDNKRSRYLLPQSHQKITHYYGDGKGRDFFVTVSDGGQSRPHTWRSQVDFFFKDHLRNYNDGWMERPPVLQYLQNNERLQNLSKMKVRRQNQISRQLSMPKMQLLSTEMKSNQDKRILSMTKVNQSEDRE